MVTDDHEKNTLLWHRRLGHMSEKGLVELEKQGLSCGDKLGKLQSCENCVLGKSRRLKFGKSKHITTEVLIYVHLDLWGLIQHASLGGVKYFMTIIDDFSRKVSVHILQSKEATFMTFKDWKIMVETQIRRKVKKLRTNNRLEYVKHEFEDYCLKERIKGRK